jgi:phosphoribosylamine--glycine ligase
VDGQTIFVLEPAQDYKRLGAGDTGPNTGGMGSFSPTSVLDDELLAEIQRQILVPTLDGLTREGIHYCGVLYAGLMLTPAGPKVLEFNCRFGDPETQAILMRLQSDLLELLDAAVSGHLEDAAVRWDPRHALCVVMASQGYPDKYRTGLPITGLPEDALRDDLAIFHAGTRIQDGQVVTSGGRVLGVTALGGSLSDARRVAYEAVGRIHFEGAYFRPDLGQE